MSITITGVCIVAVLLIFVLYGMHMGLIKAVIDLLSFFITALLAWLLYPSVTALLIKTPFYENVKNWISVTLNDNLTLDVDSFYAGLPYFLRDSVAASTKGMVTNALESATDILTVLAMSVISIILLFVVLRVGTYLLKKLGKKINKIVFIGPVNKVLGGAFGALQGILVVYFVIMLISYFPASSLYQRVGEDLSKSAVGQVMFAENMKFFGWTVKYPVIR